MWQVKTRILAGASAVVLAGAGVAAAVTLTGGQTAAPRPKPKPVASATPTPSPTPTQLLSPFTGEPVSSLGPVLAVKIDNILYARPQTGLIAADIVYVLPVEGGLTRFLVVFSSHFPPVIGPVRSARADDLQLLGQFGRPAFAFSGAQGQLLPKVEHANIVDLYAGLVGGYYRNYDRIAPYNLYATTSTLLAEAKGASTAHSIGFKFGPAPAGGQVMASDTVSYPSAKFTFTWSAATNSWQVSMDGTPAVTTAGRRFSPATVIIQHTLVYKSGYLEYGFPPPYATTVGQGTAVVLRNGRAYNARWSRPTLTGGTTYTTPSGQPMTFAPGQVWVLLTGNPKIESG
jgi:Protein of unknown function (DUF3048) N-terminal domain/Protein of unknown function (DUF3048) C-terminal domain